MLQFNEFFVWQPQFHRRKPHHRIRVSKSMREDIKVWLTFLSEYNGVTVITDNAWASNETLELFTDRQKG
jgi:hypothetical protein